MRAWPALLLIACRGPAERAEAPSHPPAPVTPTPSSSPAPTELAGMRLGMVLTDWMDACRAVGKLLPTNDDHTVMCTVPPKPFLGFDGVITGRFCGMPGKLCQIDYIVYGKATEREGQIQAAVDALTQKFGPPNASLGDPTPGPTCVAAKSVVHYVRTWSAGRARLMFDCDLRNGSTAETPLTLSYGTSPIADQDANP